MVFIVSPYQKTVTLNVNTNTTTFHSSKLAIQENSGIPISVQQTFGDSLHLAVPEPGLSTVANVCGSIKCVVVLITDRPGVIQPYLSATDALVAAWLPGTEGQGVAGLLFGDYGFTGKLARTWFKTVDQLRMNVGDRHYDPLFPFGFSLTIKPTKY
ncbi:Beta-glucosidase like [Quillaja saponaria]|uniref:beta-glucosidase n=1 Tax=Quillaja saponaria TaxID=32244 RepID=A0AAD7LLJ5_QUISA|nr:Beta-glucosidase like [Quillaja saponaria]